MKTKYILLAILLGNILFYGCSSDEEVTTIPVEYTNNYVSDNGSNNYSNDNTYSSENFSSNNSSSSSTPSDGIPIFLQRTVDTATAYLDNITNLASEYDRISKETDGIQEEYKATINAYNAALHCQESPENEEYKIRYEKKMDRLLEVHQENINNGIEPGPNIYKSPDISWVVSTLSNNTNILSDRLSELKRVKGKVVERQTKKY